MIEETLAHYIPNPYPSRFICKWFHRMETVYKIILFSSVFLLTLNQSLSASNKLESESIQCFEKDDFLVNKNDIFQSGCKDTFGNTFKNHEYLTSCHQCIRYLNAYLPQKLCCNLKRYTCLSLPNVKQLDLYFWNTTISPECCVQDKTVYKANTIIGSEIENDECQTMKTSVCRKISGTLLQCNFFISLYR